AVPRRPAAGGATTAPERAGGPHRPGVRRAGAPRPARADRRRATQPGRAVPRLLPHPRAGRRPRRGPVRQAARPGDRPGGPERGEGPAMRPVLLEMNGFASFREPTEVDFRGADYFALVGPTGSGKSTVVDAITFALYGSAPRWGN